MLEGIDVLLIALHDSNVCYTVLTWAPLDYGVRKGSGEGHFISNLGSSSLPNLLPGTLFLGSIIYFIKVVYVSACLRPFRSKFGKTKMTTARKK